MHPYAEEEVQGQVKVAIVPSKEAKYKPGGVLLQTPTSSSSSSGGDGEGERCSVIKWQEMPEKLRTPQETRHRRQLLTTHSIVVSCCRVDGAITVIRESGNLNTFTEYDLVSL